MARYRREAVVSTGPATNGSLLSLKVEISVTSPAALASGENAPHHIVWSAWHSWVMPLSGRLYHACFCWRQWHHDRQIEEAWSFRSMYVLSKSAKWIIFFVFCVDFEAVFRHVPFTARLGNVDFWILRLRFYKEKSHWCLQWLAVWCGLLLLWKGRQEACVRRSLHALMEWPEDAGDDFPREISAVALEFPFVSFWQRSTRLTTLQRCRRTVHRDYLWAMVWVLLRLIPHQRCSRSYLGSSARLPWLSALSACGLFQSVYCNVDRLLLLLLLLFYFFHSLDFGVFNEISRGHLRCGSCIFSMAKVNCCCKGQRISAESC